jgi:phosphoribosylanthranilate isomerase
MPRVKVKICGLQEERHMRAAAEAGADYVGMVFAPSRRRVTPEQAEHLRKSLDEFETRPAVVGVFVNEAAAVVNALAARCRLDFVQLSGDEDSDYCERMTRPVIKSLRVYPATTTPDIERQMATISRGGVIQSISFLLDTGDVGLRGGTGRSFDWRVASEISALRPVMVAGGLDAVTVRSLVREVRPFGVDVSSGVERDGGKDATLIRAFVDAVREAE